MKISEIRALTTDSYPIASIDRSKIESISPPDNGSQKVIISQEGKKLTLFIKCQNLFLGDDDAPAEISFMSGPPVNKKPTGLIFRIVNGKPRVNVTEKAIMKLHSGTNEDTEEEDEIQLTETPPEVVDVEEEYAVEPGPNDTLIEECYWERLHILNILKKLNEATGAPFTMEALYPMVTSIAIDAQKANKKIIYGRPSVKKTKKFDSYEKKHQPAAKKAAEADDEVDEDPIMTQIMMFTSKDYMKVIHKKSKDTILKILKDPDRRGKMIRWALIVGDGDAGGEGAAHKAIMTFLDQISKNVKAELIMSAIDADLKKMDPDCDMSYSELSEHVGEVIEQSGKKLDPTDPLNIGLAYFSLSEENRGPSTL